MRLKFVTPTPQRLNQTETLPGRQHIFQVETLYPALPFAMFHFAKKAH